MAIVNTNSTIEEDIATIRSAIYGQDMRTAIADGIEKTKNKSSSIVEDLSDNVVHVDESQNLTNSQKETARENIGAASDELGRVAVRVDKQQEFTSTQKEIARNNIDAVNVIDDRLLSKLIKNTSQRIVYVDNKIVGINHVDINNNAHIVRTDRYSLNENPIIETRTLDTGERLDISTNLTTLTTTIIYTSATT